MAAAMGPEAFRRGAYSDGKIKTIKWAIFDVQRDGRPSGNRAEQELATGGNDSIVTAPDHNK
jgi:hypothetical protein